MERSLIESAVRQAGKRRVDKPRRPTSSIHRLSVASASKKVASAKYREFAHSDSVADQGLHAIHLATGQEAADEFLESGRGKSTALNHRIPGSIGGMPNQLLGVEEVTTAVASRAPTVRRTRTSRQRSATCTSTTGSWLTRRTLSSRIVADGYSAMPPSCF